MSEPISISKLKVEIDEIIDILNGYKDNKIPVNLKSVENTIKIRNEELNCDNITFDTGVMNDNNLISFLGIKVYRGSGNIPDYIYRHYIYINPENNIISSIVKAKNNDFYTTHGERLF